MFLAGVLFGVGIVGCWLIGEACHQAQQMKKRKANEPVGEGLKDA